MSNSYEGKVVLVTGANSGIGEATAAAFRKAGATVYGTARSRPNLEAARTRHPEIHWVLMDVTQAKQVDAAVEAVVREAGRLDVVVNNAAIFAFVPLEHASDEIVRSQFEANVYGTSNVARAALPALKASRGSIVNIGSAAGHKPAPGGSHYAATKAAVESLTRSWALELAPVGVRVNAVAPGPVDTPGFDKLGLPAETLSKMKAAFLGQVPLGRWGEADEIARWIVAVGDPGETWLTGQVISIDGGMSLT